MKTKSYPPFLDEIHERCPKAASIYTKLWRERNKENVTSYRKETITDEEGISWKTFLYTLRALRKERVIKFSFNSEMDFIKISLLNKPSRDVEKAA